MDSDDDDDDDNENDCHTRRNCPEVNQRESALNNSEFVRGCENDPLTEYENLRDILIYREVFGKESENIQRRRMAPFTDITTLDSSSLGENLSDSNGTKTCSDKSFFGHGPVSEETMKVISATYTRPARDIPTIPEKILYVPGIMDDFYMNPLSWSKNNIIAITLKDGMYILNVETSVSEEIFLSNDFETSLEFSPSEPSTLAIGTNAGHVTLYNMQRPTSPKPFSSWDLTRVKSVGALCWSPNGSTLACGTRAGPIGLIDPREPQKAVNFMGSNSGHKKEICGLKWNPQGTLIASGGDDNYVMVWDIRSYSNPLKIFTGHESAVRALAWSPHSHGQLVTGGGTADKTIRFWDTNTLASLGKLNVGSQVCGLHWSSLADEIVSTHGFSHNHVKVWDAKTRGGIAVLCGHNSRILNLAVSPDERKIVTGSPDERMCFWNLYPATPASLNDSFR